MALKGRVMAATVVLVRPVPMGDAAVVVNGGDDEEEVGKNDKCCIICMVVVASDEEEGRFIPILPVW